MSITAQKTIKFEPTLELGYEDRNMQFGETLFPWLVNSYFGKFDVIARYANFKFDTDVKTYFIPIQMANYRPLQVEYTISMSYQYKNYILSAFHMCSHSIESSVYRESINRISLKIQLYDTR